MHTTGISLHGVEKGNWTFALKM